MKRFLTTLALIAVGLILFSLTAILLIPSDMLLNSVKARLKRDHGIILTEESSERVLPFGIRAEGLRVSNRVGDSIYFETITAKFAPLALLSGGLMTNIDVAIAGGSVKGYVLLKSGVTEIEAEAEAIGLAAIEAIADAGFKGPGSLSGTVSARLPRTGCPEGTVDLKAVELDGENLKVKGLRIPFGQIKDAGLKATAKECRVEISKLWIDGLGMSARLSGVISLAEPLKRSIVDLHAEIVPKGAVAEDPTLPLLLNRYRRSANYYSIKIRGTLERPNVSP